MVKSFLTDVFSPLLSSIRPKDKMKSPPNRSESFASASVSENSQSDSPVCTNASIESEFHVETSEWSTANDDPSVVSKKRMEVKVSHIKTVRTQWETDAQVIPQTISEESGPTQSASSSINHDELPSFDVDSSAARESSDVPAASSSSRRKRRRVRYSEDSMPLCSNEPKPPPGIIRERTRSDREGLATGDTVQDRLPGILKEAPNKQRKRSRAEMTQSEHSINRVDRRYNEGRWSEEEKMKFLIGLRRFGGGLATSKCENIQSYVSTRSVRQIKSHMQKIMVRQQAGEDVFADLVAWEAANQQPKPRKPGRPRKDKKAGQLSSEIKDTPRVSCSRNFPKSRFDVSFDYHVVHKLASAKVLSRSHEAALKFCHNTLSLWYQEARRIMYRLEQSEWNDEDLHTRAMMLRERLAGMWCVYAHVVVEIGTSIFCPGLREETNEILDRSRDCRDDKTIFEYPEYAASLLSIAKSCPLVGNHPWIVIARSRLMFYGMELKLKFPNRKNARNGVSRAGTDDGLVKEDQSCAIMIKELISYATPVCNDGLRTSTSLTDSLAEHLLSSPFPEQAGSQLFDDMDQFLGHVACLMKAIHTDFSPFYFFDHKEGAKILCYEINRLSRMEEMITGEGARPLVDCSAKLSYGLGSFRFFNAIDVQWDSPREPHVHLHTPVVKPSYLRNFIAVAEMATSNEQDEPPNAVMGATESDGKASADLTSSAESSTEIVPANGRDKHLKEVMGATGSDDKLSSDLKTSAIESNPPGAEMTTAKVQDTSPKEIEQPTTTKPCVTIGSEPLSLEISRTTPSDTTVISRRKSRILEVEYGPGFKTSAIEGNPPEAKMTTANAQDTPPRARKQPTFTKSSVVIGSEPSSVEISRPTTSDAAVSPRRKSRILEVEYAPGVDWEYPPFFSPSPDSLRNRNRAPEGASDEPVSPERVQEIKYACSGCLSGLFPSETQRYQHELVCSAAFPRDAKFGRELLPGTTKSLDPESSRFFRGNDVQDPVDYVVDVVTVTREHLKRRPSSACQLAIGQVGLGCMFCRGDEETLNEDSTIFPPSTELLPNAMLRLCLTHLDSCKEMSRDAKVAYRKYRKTVNMKDAEHRAYWEDQAKSMTDRGENRGIFWRRRGASR